MPQLPTTQQSSLSGQVTPLKLATWFRAAGLDLSSADEEEVAGFIRAYRGRAATAETSEATGA